MSDIRSDLAKPPSFAKVPESSVRDHKPNDAIIKIQRVGKTFVANGRELVVFNELSYDIEAGSFLSIIGPSGCGKSTLLKLVAGLELPSSGKILFNQAAIDGPPKGIVYVFQQYSKSIFPWRTVIQNIAFGLQARTDLTRGETKSMCEKYTQLVGLQGYEHYYPSQLSGGMQQRVCIARALISEPAVLLMDEPFSAVDAMTRAILQELVLNIWEKLPITVLFVTHDVDEAVFLSSRIISLGRAPASIKKDVVIDLPYPRDQIQTRGERRFTEMNQQLFSSIFMQEKTAVAGISNT
jgi:NitT/TauT family transport system ATP-binding protein